MAIMDPSDWQSVTSIIDRALELPEENRAEYIQTECSGNSSVLKEVLSFLDAIDKSEGLWSSLLESNQILVDDYTAVNNGSSSLPAEQEIIPDQFGHYKVLNKIASGGMGNVYLAERNDGQFQRRVAIKVLRREFHSETHIERFYSERNILSGLEHQNIARLYDGGLTNDGRPYLVMEYVDGLPIHQYCEKNSCSFEKRLQLFEEICSAVSYAHNHLVVHRDLKPDNIYVTNEGSIKILDFGIAKIVDPSDSELSIIKEKKEELILSLFYASPEQIRKEKITTATDVYMLGLVFYELITGEHPYRFVSSKSFSDAAEIISQHNPAAPSSVTGLNQFQSKFKGDLDAIVLKAIEKSPEDRYESAAKLLDDLIRYRKQRPVIAREKSGLYLAGKFMKRNRNAVFTIAAFSIFLSLFLIYHIMEISKERNLAELESQKAQLVTNFMTDIFSSANPVLNADDTLTVFQLLLRGKDRIAVMNGQPELQFEFLLAIGTSYQNLGKYEEAEKLFLDADSISTTHFSKDPYRIANAALHLGSLYNSSRGFEMAREQYEKASEYIGIFSERHWLEKAKLHHGMGIALSELGEPNEAENHIREAILLKEENTASISSILSSKTVLAQNLRFQERYEEAKELYLEILNEYEKLPSENQYRMAITLNNLGYLYRVTGQFKDSEIYYRRALEIDKTYFGVDHPNTLMVMNNLASVLQLLERYDESLDILKNKLELARKRYGEHWRTGLDTGSIGRFYFRLSKFSEAADFLLASQEIYQNVLGQEHFWTGIQNLYYIIAQKNLGQYDAPISSTPVFKTMTEHRDSFTYQDSITFAQLIDYTELYSLVNMERDLADLKELLHKR